MRRLPPLNALKAFEATARHASMQAAASELNVTPAAISQQVRALERYLDVVLFRRIVRGLQLTEDGLVYLREARNAFDRLATATEQLVERRVAGVLRVSVIPSLANRWLAPRLSTFLDRYPDVTLRLIEDVRPVDFNRDPFDIAIRYGLGDYEGLQSERIMGDELFPVCAPALVGSLDPPRRLGRLATLPLLHEAVQARGEPWSCWAPWLEAAGVVRDVAADRGPRLNGTATLMRAAEAGLGVAIGRKRLIADELAHGRLVRPFDVARPSRLAYWSVSPADTALLPRVAAFREWIKQEAGEAETTAVATAAE